MSYPNAWEFYRDLATLIKRGVTLPGLYEALLSVDDTQITSPDVSPARLRELASSWTQRPSFLPIRLAELFGGAQVERSDDYVLALVAGLGGRHETEVRAFMLRNDHELRTEVFWRIFEVEGGGEISLANVDKFSREEGNWHNTVVALVADGTLDRQRVLHSSLEALNRDFSSYRAGWFSRLYSALKPSAAEAARGHDLLLLSLGSSVTATVSLAAQQLAAIHKAGLLDADAFIEAAPAALAGGKATATTVLRTLIAIAADAGAGAVVGAGVGSDLATNAGRADAAAHAIAQATAHPHADVQRAAISALQKLGRAELLDAASATLSPAVAAELAGNNAERSGALLADSNAPASAATEPLAAHPVLPFTDVDALERWAALLEHPGDAIEFELAVAWLVTSERATELFEPLRKRAAALAERSGDHYPALLVASTLDPAREFLAQQYYVPVTTVVRDGVTLATAGKRAPRPSAEKTNVLPSFIVRMREIVSIVQGRAARRPLLAVPSDSHGFVDTDALLARLRTTREAGLEPLPADLAQAVLRVRPHDRDAVVAAAHAEAPLITESIRIEWRSSESDTKKANGSPQWVWWNPFVHADPSEEPSPIDPALIPSSPVDIYGTYRGTSDLVTQELALVYPPSTLRLAAVGIGILTSAVSESAEHRAGPVLDALAEHPGAWTAETAQLVALALSAAQAPLRARGVEILVSAVPTRITAHEMARACAECAPACILTRWASSFTDAATIDAAAVVDVLTALLPRFDSSMRGIGALLTVLLDESLRIARPATDPPLRAWLAEFTGSSVAARAARQLLVPSH